MMDIEPAPFSTALALSDMGTLRLISFLNGVVEMSWNNAGIFVHSRRREWFGALGFLKRIVFLKI